MKLLIGYAVAVKHHLRGEHGVGYEDFQGLLPMIPVKKGMSTSHPVGSTSLINDTTPLLGEITDNPDTHKSNYACGCTNVPLAISQSLTSLISGKLAKGTISPVVGGAVLSAITSMVDVLTNLDRILTTKIPQAYAIHLKHILTLYILLLPYQLMAGLGWITIPTVTLAAFTLVGIEQIGIEIENPFGYDANDLPQDIFCNVLHREIDILIDEPNVDYESGWDFEGFLAAQPGTTRRMGKAGIAAQIAGVFSN
ncbi:hypothetical protein HK101_007212 [Irineochytrium annulatum]|nr:hypothetical protein HK101_007212 [Irineochytrium annulatum]